MEARGWIIFAIITALTLGGLVFMSTQNKIDVSEFDSNSIIVANEKNGEIADHEYGAKAAEAAVVIYEYGDFQCPGCAGAYERTKNIVDRYPDHVSLVFRNLPLTQIHPNALAAASVAEAAGLQGRYWEMHGLLFENQTLWASASSSERGAIFEQYARDLALNIDKFKEDVASEAINKKIRFDQAIYRQLDRDPSTPTFVIDGEVLDSADVANEDSFDALVRARLIEAGIELEEEPES